MGFQFLLLLLVASVFIDSASGDENQIPELEDISQEDNFEGALSDWQIKPKKIHDVPGLTEDMLVEAINEAKKETEEDEKNTPRKSSVTLSSHYRRFVPELEPARIGAMIMERTVKRLATKLKMSNKEAVRALEGLESDHLKQLYKDDTENDAGHVYFNSNRYRTIDGKGNNVYHHFWGAARTPFRRLIPPDYGDKISTPRVRESGHPLPNARRVSKTVFRQKNRNSVRMSHMVMIWGQFIDHDITIGVQPDVDCSGNCNLVKECFGIPVSPNDTPFRGKRCIELKRDVAAQAHYLRYREQVNAKSAYIDASQVYGDNATDFQDLRLAGTPFLRDMKHPANDKCRVYKNLLPKQVGGFCRSSNVTERPCFKAGDERTNENQGLASMHTIWLREHNHIATELKKLNSHWNADKVFFEARKIVGAMIQHITYKEFLPLILNRKTINRFQLRLTPRGFYYGYEPNLDATISNAFAAAAFRFGHSLVQEKFNRFGRCYQKINPPIQMNRFFDPTFLYQTEKGGVDSILRGLVKDRSQKVDRFFSKAVQEQLVREPEDLADLPALNIQRGREHGLPGYNAFRKWTGLRKARSFRQLRRSIPWYRLRVLRRVYRHPDDIDLFVGGMYEKPLRGGVLGRVFSFILADQFRRLKRGDRFWYENTGVFTAAQLKEIRKVRLSKVICRNSDGIRRIQYWAMARQKRLYYCWKLHKHSLNLNRWRATAYHV